MKIAILGWGSLLWEGGEEFDRWHDVWREGGPILKLEFSRISEKKRLGALTLVIDEEHGIPVTVAWCLSSRARLEDVVSDLRCREDTMVENISYLNIVSLGNRSNDSTAENRILEWAQAKVMDAVVWTSLKSNFTKKTAQRFSVANAVSYLKALSPEGKSKAAEYVWRAPAFVETPVRSALQKEPWFQEYRPRGDP